MTNWTRYECLTPITGPTQPEKWVWCNGGQHIESRVKSEANTFTTEMREIPCDCRAGAVERQENSNAGD